MKTSLPIDDFLEKACTDSRLLPSHLALFMAIFYYSPPDNPHQEFRVTREKLMKFSKIKSNTTYHKCLNDLVDLDYILYQPSYNTYKGSQVTIRKS